MPILQMAQAYSIDRKISLRTAWSKDVMDRI